MDGESNEHHQNRLDGFQQIITSINRLLGKWGTNMGRMWDEWGMNRDIVIFYVDWYGLGRMGTNRDFSF